VKCQLPLLIGKGGVLVKPKQRKVSERIARTASASFSRRELAEHSADKDRTVRLVSADQIPRSVEVEVRRDPTSEKAPSPGLPVGRTVDCVNADDFSGDDTVAHGAADKLLASVHSEVDLAIREKRVLQNRFVLQEQIGAGAYGRVMVALDKRTDKKVAVKVHFNTVGDSNEAEEERKRVSRSFELQGKVLSPYCVQTIALLVEKFGLVLVEEFAEGKNLKELVQDKGPLSELDVIFIGIQMCSVLQAAHSVLQIVHRDIKPDNIVMLADGTIKLIDWGCARSNSKDKRDSGGVSLEDIEQLDIETRIDTITIAGFIIGTPNYMAPEQVDGQRVTIKSDLCSLGATMFFLVTGQKPFIGDNLGSLLKAVLYEKPPHPNTLLPEGAEKLTKRFCKVLMKAMEKKPERRYQSPEEMKQALEACLSSEIKLKPPSWITSFRNWLNGR
jgi:serine/threonine protein kinase